MRLGRRVSYSILPATICIICTQHAETGADIDISGPTHILEDPSPGTDANINCKGALATADV